MSRIEFAGRGIPIPEIALPDPNLSSDLPIQSLELLDGTSFEKADWVALGYTHYEVWCIGGAGGLGAMPGYPVFPTLYTLEHAPDDIWAANVAAAAAYDPNYDVVDYRYSYIEPGNPNYPPGGVPGVDYGWPHTHRQWDEHNNPNHLMNVATRLAPFMAEITAAFGGGGGGGGLHVVSGALADLPDSVPVSVGLAGADAPPGQNQVDGPQVLPQTQTWAERYVGPPNPTFLPPQPGGDGGTSSFGDIAKASGGKGGYPSEVWSGGRIGIDGAGGEGGVGNRDAPGGGAPGSNSGAYGADGTWDGTVGKGGGGGRGGFYIPPSSGPVVGASTGG